MVRMPEEERLDTLRVLQAKEEEIRQALAKMPLIMELPSQVIAPTFRAVSR